MTHATHSSNSISANSTMARTKRAAVSWLGKMKTCARRSETAVAIVHRRIPRRLADSPAGLPLTTHHSTTHLPLPYRADGAADKVITVGGGDLDVDQVAGLQPLGLHADDGVDVGRVHVAASDDVAGYFGIRAVHDHLELPADLPAAPIERNCLLRFHEPIAPRLLDPFRKVLIEPRGRCARLERIREHADALKRARLRERDEFFELVIRLAGEADDERRPQDEIRYRRTQSRQQILRLRAVHAPLHALEHAVVDVL